MWVLFLAKIFSPNYNGKISPWKRQATRHPNGFLRSLHVYNNRNIRKILLWSFLWSKLDAFFWVRKRQNSWCDCKHIYWSRRNTSFYFIVNSISGFAWNSGCFYGFFDFRHSNCFEYRRHNSLDGLLSKARFQNCATLCVIYKATNEHLGSWLDLASVDNKLNTMSRNCLAILFHISWLFPITKKVKYLLVHRVCLAFHHILHISSSLLI